MKICKVKITKKLNGIKCTNVYPYGYNAYHINVVAYDENPLSEGDNIGYCIGLVADDFVFTDDMVQITKTGANTFIDAYANIALKDNDLKTKYKKTRKSIITDAGI